jgi:predicted Zn-dependent protease
MLLLSLSFSCAKTEEPNEPNKALLEEQVTEYLNTGNVDLREHVEELFSLADIYKEEGKDKEAMKLYQEALTVNAWRLDYQFKMAELLRKHGEKNEAVEKVKTVYEYAEDESLIKDAEKFLSELEELPDQQTAKAKSLNIEIMIVPIGKINQILLDEVITQLQETMGIRYSISEKTFDLGTIDRSYVDKYLTSIIENIKSRGTPEKFQQLLTELNLERIDLDSRKSKIKFLDKFYRAIQISEEELEQFHKYIEEYKNEGQYDSERLVKELEKTFKVKATPSFKGYLAITEADIFTSDYNFLYGWGRKGHAVMSYHRFRAAFTKEPPNRSRLVKRTVKQGISSSFFILGIERCSTPTCARAYPHDLIEHDQKTIEICSSCEKQLHSFIGGN